MKQLLWFLLAGWLATGAVGAQSLSLTGPEEAELLEGAKLTITWAASDVQSVSVVAEGERTPLGTRSRGVYQIPLGAGVAATEGAVPWEVPWLDGIQFILRAKGYDAQGREVAVAERVYRFRPGVLADRKADGIYLDLHLPKNQRLYVQKAGEITHAYISSSSENYHWLRPGRHIGEPHDHAGVFRVRSKSRMHWSNIFEVRMPYAMQYHGGHFIHATSRNLYRQLGEPASAGCNRMTLHDAQELYRMTPRGTRVEVIGPEG